jgi:hypothetical protein
VIFGLKIYHLATLSAASVTWNQSQIQKLELWFEYEKLGLT